MDNIDEIFTELHDRLPSEQVWQKYSTGIDSCSKIYGYCVDYLHAETFKLLGGIARSEHLPQ